MRCAGVIVLLLTGAAAVAQPDVRGDEKEQSQATYEGDVGSVRVQEEGTWSAGRPLSLRGNKAVLLHFWDAKRSAKSDLDLVMHLHEAYWRSDLFVRSIFVGDPDDLPRFAEEQARRRFVVVDADGQTAAAFDVKSLPAVFVLDRRGTVCCMESSAKDLEAEIRKVLREDWNVQGDRGGEQIKHGPPAKLEPPRKLASRWRSRTYDVYENGKKTGTVVMSHKNDRVDRKKALRMTDEATWSEDGEQRRFRFDTYCTDPKVLTAWKVKAEFLDANPPGPSIDLTFEDGRMTGRTKDEEISRALPSGPVVSHFGIYRLAALMPQKAGVEFEFNRLDFQDARISWGNTLVCVGEEQIEYDGKMQKTWKFEVRRGTEVREAIWIDRRGTMLKGTLSRRSYLLLVDD